MSKTVKVRIAVAVCSKGHYGAWGTDLATDQRRRKNALGAACSCGAPRSLRWVTADVPLPQAVEIQGAVEPSDWTDERAWCGTCNAEMELVRPGKHQPLCDCP